MVYHLTGMKQIFLIFILAFSIGNVSGQYYKHWYKDKLEAGSKLLKWDQQFTMELLKSGEYMVKVYYPPTKQITTLGTFLDKNLMIKNGLYQENWDDGTIVNRGIYKNNLREGLWILNTYESGEFKNDQKTGEWKFSDPDTGITKFENYEEGKLHGKQITLDSLGNIILEKIYEHGRFISSTGEKQIDEMPRFPGCDETIMSGPELIKCSREKLSHYMYTNLRYPRTALENNIQGKAVVQFTVDENGNLTDIKMLNGISQEITQEVIRLVKNMPRWKPGTRNGKPAKVVYTMPVQFNM